MEILQAVDPESVLLCSEKKHRLLRRLYRSNVWLLQAYSSIHIARSSTIDNIAKLGKLYYLWFYAVYNNMNVHNYLYVNTHSINGTLRLTAL